jgi:hypothetical protein
MIGMGLEEATNSARVLVVLIKTEGLFIRTLGLLG